MPSKKGEISKAGTQEASKRGQEAPQSSQKPAKRPTRATQGRPGPVQNPARRAPRRGWSRIFVGSFVRHAPEVILYRFSVCATSYRYVKTCENLRKTMVFTHQELCRIECSQARKNFRKSGSGASPTLQNRARSGPRRKKINQERQ